MQANTVNLGLGFYKLVQAKNSNMREDIVGYDGDDTDLLQHYVIATDDDGYDYVSCEASALSTVEVVQVNTVAVIGNSNFEVRCYANTITAYRDEAGDFWMDATLHDEVFC